MPLDTTRSGDTVSASLDLKDCAGVVGEFMFSGSASFEDDTVDFGRRLTNIADAKAMGVTYAVRYFGENVYQVVSSGKHFSVNIPDSMYNDDTGPKSGKLRIEDAQRLGEDLESILSDYKKDFPKNTRSKWPVQVEKNTYAGTAGGYGGGLTQNGCLLYLSFEKLSRGYKDGDKFGDDGTSISMYHTIAHELFHFIQWEYTNKQFRSLWFDEATAVYYEDVKGDEAGANNGNPYYTDKEAYPALRQYYGITPASTFLVGRDSAADDGYGRRALIEYLVQTFGDDFLPKLMPHYTVKSSGKPMEDLLTQQTGKTMAELTRGYYDALVAKGELKGAFTEPWEIYMGSVDSGGVSLRQMDYYSKLEYTGKAGGDKVEFPLPRYGVHFIALEPKNLPARYESFTVSLDTPNTTAILMDIHGESYDDITVYRSWDDDLEGIYLEGHSYLLMVINESDKHYGGGLIGSTASITVTVEDMNDGYDGSFPKKAEQVPPEYEGTAELRRMQKAGFRYFYTYESRDATARVSLDEGRSILSVKLIAGDGDELLSEQLQYDPATGQGVGKECTVQLERGDYEDRDLMGIRIHSNFGTGTLHGTFEGFGWPEEKEEEKPKADYSGSYRSEKKVEEDGFNFNLGSYRFAVGNAFKNAVITVSKDGSFSGSGSWSGSTSETDDGGVGLIHKMGGTRQIRESVSASVSIRGKLDENGEGTFTITGSASVSGSSNGKATEHSTDGEWPMRHPDPDRPSFTQVFHEYNCVAEEKNSWEYSFSLSGEGSADISGAEKTGSGVRTPALWLNITSDIRVSGQHRHTLDVTYPKMDWDETHNDVTSPAPDSVMLSGLYIYFP